jgi:hypothetical protein
MSIQPSPHPGPLGHWTGCGQRVAGGFGLVGIEHRQHHGVAAGGQFGERGCDTGAQRGQGDRLGWVDIIAEQSESGAAQALRAGGAHQAAAGQS